MLITNAKTFFEKFIGEPASEFKTLPQSGSARTNFIGRSQRRTFVITYNENLRENEAFFYLSDKFSKLNLNTPKILAISDEKKLYVQEFLGEHTLSELISLEGHTPEIEALVRKSLAQLFELQQKTK